MILIYSLYILKVSRKCDMFIQGINYIRETSLVDSRSQNKRKNCYKKMLNLYLSYIYI